jgi:hypothetical protein
MSKSELLSIQDRADAVMSEVDRAFAEILDATEQSVQAADQLGDQTQDSETWADMIGKIQDANARIVAVCSSQDVIRQHVDFLVKDLGNPTPADKHITDEEKLLAGPQIDGQGLSQKDIDDMFD